MFRIVGGKRLHGEVTIGGAKNAALPILAAALMATGCVNLENCPQLLDVRNMLRILQTLGCRAQQKGGHIQLCCEKASRWEMPEELSKCLRSSIFMVGPLLGRFRRAVVTYPGGCEIGLRPIDLHLKGFRALGASIKESHGMIYLDGSKMRGGDVYLDFPSVGATENVMMAAAVIRGRTRIHNAAREPEIRDLQQFINAMGGKITGAGTGMIIIDGVNTLCGTTYSPMPDRIVAGTLMTAVAAAGGEAKLLRAQESDMGAQLDKLRQVGCIIECVDDGIWVAAHKKPTSFEVSTQPFPGFPTDMQAQFMALACVAEGTSVIVENLFESRFAQAAQLTRMGADIRISNRAAIVRGGKLTGARVKATDLRGGAALVIAALAAEGETLIENTHFVDRGYENLENIIAALGGSMCRETFDTTEETACKEEQKRGI